MKEMKNEGNQKLYKVRLYKDFLFPSFSINQDNKLEDLLHRSLEEVYDNTNTEDYFSLELTHTLPFTLKEKEKPQQGRLRIGEDFNFFIREIAIDDLKEKYGSLDYKVNPDIFDKRTRTMGGLDDNPYYLKADVESFFIERMNHYSHILENKLYNNVEH